MTNKARYPLVLAITNRHYVAFGMIFALFNDRRTLCFEYVSHLFFHWLFMTSTKWFALGSFGLSTVLAYVGGFAGSAFIERQVSTESPLLRLSLQKIVLQTKIHSPKTNSRNTPNERQYVQSIVNRSIFDSSQAGAKVSSTLAPAEGDSIESSLQLTLLATIIAAPEAIQCRFDSR